MNNNLHCFDIVWVNIPSAPDSHIQQKIRPACVLTCDQTLSNANILSVCPMSRALHKSDSKRYPYHIPVDFKGNLSILLLEQFTTIPRSCVCSNKAVDRIVSKEKQQEIATALKKQIGIE